MKRVPQIYVNYFLIGFKMKKIIFLSLTFSGIYTGFAQKPTAFMVSDSLKIKTQIIDQLCKKDRSVIKEKISVKLFLNPARNKVEIEIQGFEPGFIQLQLIDNKGNLLRDDKDLSSEVTKLLC